MAWISHYTCKIVAVAEKAVCFTSQRFAAEHAAAEHAGQAAAVGSGACASNAGPRCTLSRVRCRSKRST